VHKTFLACGLGLALASCATAASYDVAEKSIAELQADLGAGAVTSEGLVEAYLERIAALDDAGPELHAVLALNPNALDDARALDAERAAGTVRGPLHGMPILVKDNIETADATPTTAGSIALAENITGRDAPAIARLRAAGAIILGKTNLSEWANIRSSSSTSGWSALGGFTKNPYALDRNPCGSSSGSGAAAAASLAAAAIGTETDGSVVCPAAINGLVGVKPTVGLVSRSRIIPISASQDTAGPMARSVADAALLLTAMAGSDPDDPATAEADARREDYTTALDAGALAGARIGAARFLTGYHEETDARFEAALRTLSAAGAEIVELEEGPDENAIGAAEIVVLLAELKAGLAAYLATAEPATPMTGIEDLIVFNQATLAELEHFGQDLFEAALAGPDLDDPEYLEALATSKRLAGPEGLDPLFTEHRLDAIVAPTTGPAWTTDAINGDHYAGSASGLPAVAGYPHVTVPMGLVGGLPVGLSFIGPAWTESRLIGLAYAYEQMAQARTPPTYAEQSPAGVE
jgi:amidase